MGALDGIIAAASLPERTVTVCTAGKLVAEMEDLQRHRAEVEREAEGTLAGTNAEAAALTEKIGVLREAMREHEHAFTFRGLPHGEYTKLVAEHPPRKGRMETLNAETFIPALVARCCVAVDGRTLDERLTIDDFESLFEVLNQGQIGDLFDGARSANERSVDVPF
jgi:hypothetical protein